MDKWIENFRFINVAAEARTNDNGSTSYIGGVGMLIEQKLADNIVGVTLVNNRILRVTLDCTKDKKQQTSDGALHLCSALQVQGC